MRKWNKIEHRLLSPAARGRGEAIIQDEVAEIDVDLARVDREVSVPAIRFVSIGHEWRSGKCPR